MLRTADEQVLCVTVAGGIQTGKLHGDRGQERAKFL